MGAPSQRLAWVVLAAGVATQIAYPLTHGPARAHLTVAIVVLMAAAALIAAGAAGGWRTTAVVGGCCAAIGFGAELIGTASSYPFGHYAYLDGLGPRVGQVPVVVALAWVMGGWPAIAAARRLRPATGTRALTEQIGIAAFGLWAWDLFLDPQMVADRRWQWQYPDPHLPGVPGVPLTNVLGWAIVAVVVCGPACLAVSRLAGPGGCAGRLAPGEAQFLWAWLGSALAHAAFLGLPWSALWGGAAMGCVGVPLVLRVVRGSASPTSCPAPAPPMLSKARR